MKLKKLLLNLLIVKLILFAGLNSFAQTFSVEVQLKNQPDNKIVFGSVKGDDFTAIDSTSLKQSFGKIKFTFPENAHPGVYRINLGTTTAGKILNEPPQTIDFVFDNENLVFDTDFKAPVDNLKIIKSKENTAWFGFLEKDKIIRQNIETLATEIDNFWMKGDTAKVISKANEFNQLQMERDMFISKTLDENRGLFASLMIKNLREPLLDGYLTPAERKLTYKKEFFKTVDFSDPLLINSTIYTDNIFKYLVNYNQYDFTQKQREAEYIKALDVIVPNIKSNDEVYRFLMTYLVHGFEVLKMENVISYISKKYNFPQ
ncbi:MAG TPA: hypothetical protein PLC80_12455 [Draconibacterium sp.]|nr:hypothetical protein [Draconibacterium sp.]